MGAFVTPFDPPDPGRTRGCGPPGRAASDAARPESVGGLRFGGMRHATPEDLKKIATLLDELRLVPGLVERSPGSFYRRSQGFLHFHDDPSGMYADLRLEAGGDFVRLRAQTKAEQRSLLRQVRRAVGEG
jgi:hypothetical protein